LVGLTPRIAKAGESGALMSVIVALISHDDVTVAMQSGLAVAGAALLVDDELADVLAASLDPDVVWDQRGIPHRNSRINAKEFLVSAEIFIVALLVCNIVRVGLCEQRVIALFDRDLEFRRDSVRCILGHKRDIPEKLFP